LEAELTLENIIVEVAVLAGVRVIDLVVRAHNGASSSTDGISERPEVQLVESNVIDVGAGSFADIAARLITALTEVFLLVENVMLSARNDTSVLNTLDGFGNGHSTEVWVWRESMML